MLVSSPPAGFSPVPLSRVVVHRTRPLRSLPPLAFTLCLLALQPWNALAFRGRVVDPGGQPMAQAEVYVLGRPGEAITDAEGRFEWQPDPSPPFEILVVAPGGTYMTPVLVEALDPAAELLVPHVVTLPVVDAGDRFLRTEL